MEEAEKGSNCQLFIMQILSQSAEQIPPPYPNNGIIHKCVLHFFYILVVDLIWVSVYPNNGPS